MGDESVATTKLGMIENKKELSPLKCQALRLNCWRCKYESTRQSSLGYVFPVPKKQAESSQRKRDKALR